MPLFSIGQINLSWNNAEVESGDTISFFSAEIELTDIMYAAGISIQNTSSSEQHIIVKKFDIDVQEGSETQICWTGFCYGPLQYTTPFASVVNPEEFNHSFDGYYLPNDNEGVSIIEYVFIDTLNNDSISFIAKYDAREISVPTVYTEADVEVYPNPFSSELKIENLPNDAVMFLYDLSGNLLQTFTSQSDLNLDILRAGTYILSINHKRQIKVVKTTF